ncbi:MAG: DUF1217 domain-containing protein [Hyphomicrobiales bacterium]|nr:DUF1217 domain-containing protein [Hyphomicrobiales bacterium]
MLSVAATYQMYGLNLESALDRVSQQPVVSRETEYYKANIANVKSIDDFMNDDRLYQYAMKAHGLEDMTYAKAFMRKALTEGIDDPNSFANSLANSRYKDFVETFNFERYGETAIVFDRAQQGTVDLYVRQVLEEDAGALNEGARLALYFERKAPELETTLEVLADKALSQVVRTALGLPEEIAAMDLDKQVDLISSRLDVEDFKDPEKLAKFIERFNALWQINNSSSQLNVTALLVGGGSSTGIGSDLLATLQNLKLGGI